MALARLDQRRQRQRDDDGGNDRQQNGAAEIERGAEEQEEDTDIGGLAERRPDAADAVHRPRIADDDGPGGFAVRLDVVHKASSPDPNVPRLQREAAASVPAGSPGLARNSPLRRGMGLLEGPS